MTKIAVITGINGQDGSYLAEHLLDQNYTVVGLHRRSSTNTSYRIDHLLDNKNLILEEFDLTDPSSCNYIVDKYKPNELYNLAAMSHVGTSFKQPSTTLQIDTVGVINLLEAIRNISPLTRFYQASTSEMFGSNYSERTNLRTKQTEYYQDENTPFLPQSPYAVAKLASHRLIQIYREAYNIYSCSGILFNHESPRRGENFVTRKITKFIGQLVNKSLHNKKLHLGNLEAKRDWGHARDYVQAMHLMMIADSPDDYVVATSQTYTVQQFLDKAFALINEDPKDYVYIDPDLYRPCEVNYLKGDYSKAKIKLDWEPRVSFDQLVHEMVFSDIERYKHEEKL
jgi:GDPmannose 4,6-dehydratase